jgi:restriction system protein
MLLFVGHDDTRVTAVLALIALGGFFVYRWRRWRARPFAFAIDHWDKDVRARFATRQLERRDDLLTITPYDFESAIARLYQSLGMNAKQTRLSGDGGWDVEFTNGEGQRYLVECKQLGPVRAVGRPVLQKLHSALITEGASGAYCVTTGTFTQPARDFGRTHGIQLIDGRALGALMLSTYPNQADLSVRGLCGVCGATPTFDPEKLEMVYQPCGYGHWAKHPFISDGHPSATYFVKELKSSGKWTDG